MLIFFYIYLTTILNNSDAGNRQFSPNSCLSNNDNDRKKIHWKSDNVRKPTEKLSACPSKRIWRPMASTTTSC